uniref:Rho-GAP domain-containing protein n=1 Tax=Nothobranchius furzeri TaxID=105023 RepID=A0A1A7Z9S3_NOTFU
MLGQSVRLQPVPIQSLSELERARLQEVALYHLEEKDLDFKISIPTEIRKRRKSLRRRFDSFSKEKKERESASMAFGIPLSQAIANDQAYKRRQDALKESRRDCLDLEASVLRFRAEKRQFFNGSKPVVCSASITGGGLSSPSSNSVAPAPVFDTPSKPQSPTFLDNTGRAQRRGGMSVDCISDLVESQLHNDTHLVHPVLRGADQLQYLQHLLYLLPPCNCDTLLRLLSMLQTVQSFAQDSIGTNDEEIPGNKMTAANLAVIFGPNLLQKERGGDISPQAMGIEDSTAIISVTLVLIQNYKRLFTVSAELQQEVLMSLIQTDPDIIDYLLRRKLSGSHLTVESSRESGGRRDTGASLDSVGASSGSLSPLGPPSPLFPPDGRGREGSLTSEVFLNVLKLNQNRKRQEARYGEGHPRKSIHHMRQFHSHHNLLSLAQPSSSSSSSRLHGQEADPQDRQSTLSSALSFSLGGAGSCSSLSGSSEGGSIWVRQTPQEEGKASNFWDFFTGKGSGSETVV